MKARVNIKMVLDHKPLNRCIRYTSTIRAKPWVTLEERVTYTRTNDEVIHGFINNASRDCVYIFNTRTGNIVAASRNRVERR